MTLIILGLGPVFALLCVVLLLVSPATLFGLVAFAFIVLEAVLGGEGSGDGDG